MGPMGDAMIQAERRTDKTLKRHVPRRDDDDMSSLITAIWSILTA